MLFCFIYFAHPIDITHTHQIFVNNVFLDNQNTEKQQNSHKQMIKQFYYSQFQANFYLNLAATSHSLFALC